MPVPVDYEIESDAAARQRRRAAKVHNERVKMRAGAANAVGVAIVASAFIFPVIRDNDPGALLTVRTWVWIAVGGLLHWVATRYLDALRSED